MKLVFLTTQKILRIMCKTKNKIYHVNIIKFKYKKIIS